MRILAAERTDRDVRRFVGSDDMLSKTVVAGIAALAVTLGTALAQDTPSRWGKDDQAGASNHMTPKKALEAAKLMKTGTVVPLARVYEAKMPLFGARAFALRGTNGLAGGPVGENKVIWMDDFLAAEIGQVGTQFEGSSHRLPITGAACPKR